MRRRSFGVLFGAALGLALVSACANDFDAFEAETAGSEAGALDGPASVDGSSGSPGTDGSSGGGFDGSKRDAAPDGPACTQIPPKCTSDLATCKSSCDATYNTCINKGGCNPGCKNRCQQDRDTCRGACATTCLACAGSCPSFPCNN